MDIWHKYIWKIENFSYSWHKTAECISSPKFHVEGVWWRLQIYPRGNNFSNDIAFYLKSESAVKSGISFKLSFIDPEGTSLVDKTFNYEIYFSFSKDTTEGCDYFVSQDKVFVEKRMKFLPNDTLTACCHISNSGRYSGVINILARTSIEVIWETILEKIKNLSYSLEISIPSASLKKLIHKIQFSVDEGPCCDRNLSIEIFYKTDEQRKFTMCNVYLLDDTGTRIKCGKSEIWFDSPKSDQIWKFPLLFTKFELMSNKDLYLPDDMLSLQFEFSSSMGVSNEVTKRIKSDALSNSTLSLNMSDSVAESGALQDLGNLFKESILCDVNLQTSTKTFPAHKAILSARSPVFKAMFTNDLKEKMTNRVDIEDLDDETIHRFLLYIYTNTVENLQWQAASQLYIAADKYSVVSLKNKSSSILKRNLNPSNLCEILALADRHQDIQIKDSVQNFILLHDKDVIGSEEWRELELKNPLLTSETMSCVYRKSKGF